MKIVCGSCGAKYSIADEKVQGKVFKIRCKKCSNVIVVKGDVQRTGSQGGAVEGDSTMSSAYGGTSGAAQWYVVIDGEQVGPISPEEIEAYFTSGQIGPDSFTWRDGLGDWVALKELDEFAHLTEQQTEQQQESTDATAVVESPFGSADSGKDQQGGVDDETSVMTAGGFDGDAVESSASAESSATAQSSEQPFGFGAESADARGRVGDQHQPRAGGGELDGDDSEGNFGANASEGDGTQSSYDGFEQAASGQPAGYQQEQKGGGLDAGVDSAPVSGGIEAAGQQDEGQFQSGSYEQGGGYAPSEDRLDDEAESGGRDSFGSEQQQYDSGPSNDGMFAAFDADDDQDDAGYNGFSGVSGASGSAEVGLGAHNSSQSAGQGAGSGQSANDMIGERNENSVLFSLSSLDEVGAVSGGGAGGRGSGGTGPAGMGMGGGADDGGPTKEGSGLIDIQALASAHDVMKGGGGGAANGNAGQSSSGGTAEDPFGAGTMSMPALAPMGSHRSNKPLIIGLSILGIILVGGLAFAISLAMGDDEPEQPKERIVYVNKNEGGPQKAKPAKVDEAKKEAEAAAKAVDEDPAGAAADKAADADKAVAAEKGSEEADDSDKSDEDDDEHGARHASTSKEPSPKKTPKKTHRSPSKDDDVDDLIDGIAKGGRDKHKSGSSGSSAENNLPVKLGRSTVKNTVSRWSGRIKNCYRSRNRNKLSGTVFVHYTVKPSGRVSSANVTTGKFKGTDVGKCVEGVVRSMKFPESQESLTIDYPFRL